MDKYSVFITVNFDTEYNLEEFQFSAHVDSLKDAYAFWGTFMTEKADDLKKFGPVDYATFSVYRLGDGSSFDNVARIEFGF